MNKSIASLGAALGLALAFTAQAVTAQPAPAKADVAKPAPVSATAASDAKPRAERPRLRELRRDEVLRKTAERFDSQDLNKDGVLTEDEFRQAMEKLQRSMPKPPDGQGHPGGPRGAGPAPR